MHIVRRSVAVFLIVWLMAPHVSAQQTAPAAATGTQAAIDQALAARAAQAATDRESVRRVLARSEVREVAQRMGVDIERIHSSVSLLDPVELAQAAEQARAVEDALSGGATVVITTTTIIIVLLVVILIVLIAD
jgi:hypothetical protein